MECNSKVEGGARLVEKIWLSMLYRGIYERLGLNSEIKLALSVGYWM